MTARPICIVTGASGLVGRHLLPRLAESYDVVALVRNREPAPRPGVRYLVSDLSAANFTDALPPAIAAVVHLAQSRRFREFPAGAADVLAVNVGSTEQLTRYAVRAGASHFVLASTGGVYRPSASRLAEDAPLALPETAGWYVASKLAAEALVYAHRPTITSVVLRPFFIYGPGQSHDMLLPRLRDAIRAGRRIDLAGDDGLSLSLTHAADAARAVLRALQMQESRTINIAGPNAHTIREICGMLGSVVGRVPEFTVNAPPAGHFVADTTRMDTLLGAATSAFADTIADVCL